jgi:hypothetical protein
MSMELVNISADLALALILVRIHIPPCLASQFLLYLQGAEHCPVVQTVLWRSVQHPRHGAHRCATSRRAGALRQSPTLCSLYHQVIKRGISTVNVHEWPAGSALCRVWKANVCRRADEVH